MGRRRGTDLGVNRPQGNGPREHDEVHVLLEDEVGRRQQVIADIGEAMVVRLAATTGEVSCEGGEKGRRDTCE